MADAEDVDVKDAPTAAIGYTHAPTFTWWLDENETTPELQFPQSVRVFDSMRRTDSQVTSVLQAVCLPVERTPWRIDPNGARDEVVQFVADDFGLPIAGQTQVRTPLRTKNRFSWTEHLRLALLMLPYGFSYFEQLYRVDDDGSRAHLAKLEFRPHTTIDKVEVATDGGLVYVQQCWTAQNSSPRPIPVDRLVAYVHRREGGNWLGQSILRPVYKNWLLKDRLLRVQAQTIERNGMGIPVYEGAENEQSLSTGLAMATGLRSGEAAGAATPYGAKLRLMGVEGTLPDAKPAVEYHDTQIARAVLAHFLNLGTQTGSWALGSTFADFFTLSLQTLAQQIASTTTQHVIEDLVDVNWGPDEPAPRLCFDEIGSRQAATAEALKSLVDAGILHPDEPLEGATRQFYGLPPADPATATPPPGGAPTATPDAPTQTGEYSVAASAGVDLDDEASWIAAAAGVDTHPGGERLKRYWLFGAGAAKWATWTELYDHLRKYIENTKLLKATVSKWYLLRYGHTPPHHKGVHASALTGSPQALAAYAEEFGDPDADDEAEDWELQIDALAAALDELSGAVAASFNPRQPRNPKGTPAGGRFRSMVDTLKDAIEAHRTGGGTGHPFDSFDREQLRRVARKRGISLERGESKDSIAAKLLDHLGGGGTTDSDTTAASAASRIIRDSVARHANSSGWAGVADVRDDLAAAGITDRNEQDRALRAMLKEPGVRIVPVVDIKNLTDRDREGALFFTKSRNNSEAGHAIQIGNPDFKPFVPPTVDELRAELAAREASLRRDEDAGFPEEALAYQRRGIDELRRKIAEAGPVNPRAQRLADRQSKAGQKAAGVGVRKPSKAAEARKRRIEEATNKALDERDRRIAEEQAAAMSPWGDSSQWLKDAADVGAEMSEARKAKLRERAAGVAEALPEGWTVGESALSAPPLALDDLTAEKDPRADALWYRIGTNGGFLEQAEYLRGKNRTVDPEQDARIADIDSVMADSKLAEPIVVYRGISDDGSLFGRRGAVGKVVADPAYASTTTDPEVAVAFGQTVMRIRVPAGVSAVRMADRDGPNLPEGNEPQSEILLDRNLKYKVVGEHKVGDLRVLDVEVVPAL